MLQEIELIRNFGGLVAALVFMFIFSKYVTGLSFEQIKINNERTFKFMDETLKENTKSMNEMILTLKDHTRAKESAIEELKKRFPAAEVLLEPSQPYRRT